LDGRARARRGLRQGREPPQRLRVYGVVLVVFQEVGCGPREPSSAIASGPSPRMRGSPITRPCSVPRSGRSNSFARAFPRTAPRARALDCRCCLGEPSTCAPIARRRAILFSAQAPADLFALYCRPALSRRDDERHLDAGAHRRVLVAFLNDGCQSRMQIWGGIARACLRVGAQP
jgi:hypothetical protein